MKNIYIIGCGGVCTYFAPSFFKVVNYNKKLKSSTQITLVDGDVIEQKNFERQNFDNEENVGGYKSEILALHYIEKYDHDFNINAINEYITDSFQAEDKSLIFCFVDNHPARKDILTVADRNSCDCIFAANSTVGAHAYYYTHKWANTALDPRLRYPEILTIDTGSPLRAGGCDTEQHLNEVPQTAIANQFAASHALFLWNFWQFEYKTIEEDYKKYSPVEVGNNFGKLNTTRIIDIE
jgi:molybdopterin/thiamine biosynthesis adenylyltransferase